MSRKFTLSWLVLFLAVEISCQMPRKKMDQLQIQFQNQPSKMHLLALIQASGGDETAYSNAYDALMPLFTAINFGETIHLTTLDTVKIQSARECATQILLWLIQASPADIQSNALLVAGYFGWQDFEGVFTDRIKLGETWQKLAVIDALTKTSAVWADKVLLQATIDPSREIRVAAEAVRSVRK
jgi:hypothetical protein